MVFSPVPRSIGPQINIIVIIELIYLATMASCMITRHKTVTPTCVDKHGYRRYYSSRQAFS
jgi:hypothetical protein